MKKEVFAELEKVVAPEAILATNTSSLSVTEMGADLEHPERIVGMHFFNPSPSSHSSSCPHAADRRRDARHGLGGDEEVRKTGVLVRDAPGFVVNRLLGRQGSVITQALDRGNTVDETDEAVLRLGLPMAPSVLLQLVGPKVANHVRHTLHDAWPDRFPLSATLESLAEGGGEPVVVENARAASTSCTRRFWRRSRTRCATSSRRASSPRRPTSTRASSSAPASRSGSVASRSTSTRRASPSASSGDR